MGQLMAGGKRKRDSIHETPDVSYITNPDVAHEHTDVPVSPVLKFIGGLVVFAVVIHIAMWGAFKFFESRERAAERKASPLARSKDERLRPDPLLQLAPGFGVTRPDGTRTDLSHEAAKRGEVPRPESEYLKVLEDWTRELHEYGWADEKAGTVRLPIEDAMKLYVARQRERGAGSGAGGQGPGAGQTQEAQSVPRPTPAAPSPTPQHAH